MMIKINPIHINKNYHIKKNKIAFQRKNESIDTQQKNNMNIKVLITGTAIVIGVLSLLKIKKQDNSSEKLKKAQIYLKNIYNKDFSIEETKSYIKNYQNLNKINNNKDFYNKLFEQLKKDFRIENKELDLEIWETPKKIADKGYLAGYTEALSRKIGITDDSSRINTIGTIFHELKHIKQNELMYQTDKKRLVRQKVLELEKSNNESWQNILKDFEYNKTTARQYVKKEVESIYQKIWKNLMPINKNSEEYKLGLKYLENEENRIPPGIHYYEQILEKEAKFVEKNAEKLFKLLASISIFKI